MNIDYSEFKDFLVELARLLKKQGVPDNVITSSIAEAIKNREDFIFKKNKNVEEKIEEVVVKEFSVEQPQMLYAPPTYEKTELHYSELPQVLYGPPPKTETEIIHEEIPQVLYGPPPEIGGGGRKK